MGRNVDRLLDGLRTFLPEGDALTAVIPVSTGHSSETYLLEGIGQVLRLPPSAEPLFGPLQADLKLQHSVLAELATRPGGPPICQVRGLCLDDEVLGVPFMLMTRVPGEPFERELPTWLTAAHDSFRASLSEQWVDALCRTHTLAPLESLGPARSTADEWRRWRMLADIAAEPALVALFDDLLSAVPPSIGPPTVVHGDAKMANLMWEDGRLTAVLDWETAFNGDPMNDLGYALSFIPHGEDPGYPGYDLSGLWGRDQVVEEWQRRTGRTAAGVDLYVAAGIAKITSIMVYGAHLYEEGLSDDERFGRWRSAVPLYLDRVRSAMNVAS